VAATERQVVIESSGKRLVGMLHRPADDSAPRSAFLFCHPFAEEKKSSQRAFVETARRLAQEGHGALRFDFFGCGDSEGDFGETSISAWLGDIRSALHFLADELPARPYGLFGLRLGATLAALAAAEHRLTRRLVLVEPIIHGKDYFVSDLRRMLIKQMMTDGASRLRRDEIIARLERGEGDLDFDGFTISGRLYSELAALDLRAAGRSEGDVLIVQISPRRALRPELQELAEDYRRAGARVTTDSVAMPPIWNLLDEVDSSPLAEAVASWLRRTT
jgi:exosortase A-associated hydrolase 2